MPTEKFHEQKKKKREEQLILCYSAERTLYAIVQNRIKETPSETGVTIIWK